MALEAGFPSGDGVTTHAAARRDLEGAVVRNAAGKMRAGVFYAHAGDLFTRRPDMRLDIPEFRAVQDKQGACFIAGVGATTTPAFDAAPAANKRIDLLYLTQELASLDGTTETIFGIVKGTASPTPTVPALPAAVSDAIPWATVEIPAGATSMQSGGVIITPVYPYTAMAGGTVVVRNPVELAAWTPADSARAHCLSDTGEYVRVDGVWESRSPRHIEFASSVSIANSTDGTLGTLTLDASRSTDTSLVTSPSAGRLRFQPGIYSITLTADMPAATTGLTLLGLRIPPSTFIARSSFPTGSSSGLMFSIANYRIMSASTDIDTYFFQTSGATRTVPGRVVISKIG